MNQLARGEISAAAITLPLPAVSPSQLRSRLPGSSTSGTQQLPVSLRTWMINANHHSYIFLVYLCWFHWLTTSNYTTLPKSI